MNVFRIIASCYAFFVLFATDSMGQARLHIYVRSFIPKEHSGNPGYVRATSDPSKFVIPSPFGDSCFLTDNRTFSDSPNASSRMTTEFVMTISEGVTISRAENRDLFRVGATHKVDCQTGADLVPPKTASSSDMVMGHPAFADGIAQVVVDAKASNPLAFDPVPDFPGLSHFVPHIAYGGTFTFNTKTNTLRFQGSTGVFPAYEAYAQLNDGPISTLFTFKPQNGSTAVDLFDLGTGFKLQGVDVTVTLKDGINGIWQSTDPKRRFQLNIKDGVVDFTERNDTGQELTRTIPFKNSSAGTRRLARQNDEAVLTFLGFQPAIRSAVLSLGPQPSFLDIEQSGQELTGNWNGLLVIKDLHGKFQSLKQPGQTPAKVFVFKKQP